MPDGDLRAALAQPCFNSNYINGEFVPATGGATYTTISPTTEATVHACPASTSEDVDAAVGAARRAADAGFDEWGGLSATDRVQYLLALATKLQEHAPLLAELEARDVGKPVIDAHGDIMRAVTEIEECVGLAAQLDEMQGTQVYESDDVLGQRRWEPIGVVACITPWNFPLLVTVMKLAPALTAGNAVVLKPSEYSPLTTMFTARLCDEVGFPAGVVNFISGTGSSCGAPLSRSQGIDMVSFTGSVPTGSAIMGEAAKNIVKPLLELGGKSPSIVFEDVDLDQALPWVMSGFLSNTGQVCVAQTRLLVHESRKDELLSRLVAELEQVGFATDPLAVDAARMETERHRPLGPIVNKAQYDKVLSFISDAQAEGAKLVVGGSGRPPAVSTGYFVAPTVFEVEPSHSLWREEVFGPVLGVKSFRTEAEAIALANDSSFGLAANVFSQDEQRADRVASLLRAGKVR